MLRPRRTLLLILLLLLSSRESEQHARLLEPPSRASMWRLGFPTPKDQDDNQSYCGGFGVQHGLNGGLCGICGDRWDDSLRPHEAPGGIYATGIITKTYRQGSLIPVIVDITANHQGHFEFKLCPNDNIFLDPDQSCFDQYPLTTGVGREEKYPINDRELGLRLLYVRLPLEVTCKQCILQWSYVGGNNWGDCDDGTSGLGCGPQETFRSCADITITPHPLLASASSLDPFTTPFKDEGKEDEDITIDFTDISDLDDAESLRKKEELLAEKKRVLEKVLDKLQELILLSQQDPADKQASGGIGFGSSSSSWGSNDVDELRAEDSERRIFSPYSSFPSYHYDVENDHDDKDQLKSKSKWWERIFSNRH